MKRFLKTLSFALIVVAASYAASKVYHTPLTDYGKDVPALESSTPSMAVDVSPY